MEQTKKDFVRTDDVKPGQTWENAETKPDALKPGQDGRNSSAAGATPGKMGNAESNVTRPYTPVGVPGGIDRNPTYKGTKN